MSLPKVPLSESGLPIDRERAIKTFPWISFLSLSFPGQTIDNPKVVKRAKDRLRDYLNERSISYFYIYEKAPITGKPHLHLLIDKSIDRLKLHQLWVFCLPTYNVQDVHRGLSDQRIVDPDTIDTTMFTYLTKEHSNPSLRTAWQKELKEKYDISYVWGIGGTRFDQHYSSIRIGMLNGGELPPETQLDSLTTKLHKLNDHLERHQFNLTTTELHRLEKGEKHDGKLANYQSHFFNLLGAFIVVGGEAFKKHLADYLAGYDKTPYETGFKKYLDHLTSKTLLKIIVLKMSVVIRSPKGTKWPAFIYDLFHSVAIFNETAYKRYAKGNHEQVERPIAFRLGLMFYNWFASTFDAFFEFSIDDGHGDPTNETKGRFVCAAKPGTSLGSSLGDRLFDLFHNFRYPMVIPPKKWKLNEENSGGFRANGTKIKTPLVRSFDGRFQPNQKYLDGFNSLGLRPFTINYRYVEFCRNSSLPISDERMLAAREFTKAIQKQVGGTAVRKRIFEAFQHKRIKPLTPGEPVPTYEQYEEANNAVSQHYADKLVYHGFAELKKEVRAFMEKDYPGDEGFYVYFPCYADYRGRIYADTDISYTITKLSRYALQAPLARPFVFDRFKEYAVKVYFGSKNRHSPFEARAHFDAELAPRMAVFETDPSIYLDSDDQYAMAACCLEYQQLRTHLKEIGNEELGFKTYRSKFFVSLDATGSGPQIIATELRDGSLAQPLNIWPLFDLDGPANVYAVLLDRFLAYLRNDVDLHFDWRYHGFDEPTNYKESFRSGMTLQQVHTKVFLAIFKHLFMAGSYGLTRWSFTEETFKVLWAEGFKFDASSFASRVIWDYVHGHTFLGGFLDFIEIINDYILEKGITLSFPTPLGSRCTMEHRKLEYEGEASFYRYELGAVAKLMDTVGDNASEQLARTKGKSPKKFAKLRHERNTVKFWKPTEELNLVAITRATAANIIHAGDASLVTKTGSDIPLDISLCAVHDCFYSTTDVVDLIYATVQRNFYELFFAGNYLAKVFIPAMPAEIRPKLQKKLAELQAKHPFDPSFLLSPSTAGNALLH